MKKKHVTLWLNAALFLAVATLGCGLTIYFDRTTPPLQREQSEKKILSGFNFTDLSGQTHAISSFKGKIIMINFWATWCPPCVQEFPALLKIAADNKEDVVLIALSSDKEDGEIKKFLKQQKKPAKNVFIARDHEDITLKIFGISRLPETIIVDRNFNMHEKLVGAEWEPHTLQKIIDSL